MKQKPITAATADNTEETVMEQESRISKQDEETEVEGHRLSSPEQAPAGEQRVALEPAERVSLRSGEAEDGPEVEGHRAYFGPSKDAHDPGRFAI